MLIQITKATQGKLITTTKFSGYDFGMNPYVGCQIGCSYCYVRFFVQDEQRPWGEFVRTRNHIEAKLPKELAAIAGQRLVLGTMTDPYQPVERKERLTRKSLEFIRQMPTPLQKIGIFTRSPIILDDLELIRQLPNPRIHITIGAFSRPVLTRLEPIAIDIRARLKAAKVLKQAGIQVWINVSAGLPVVSFREIETIADMLQEIQPDGFYVDAMQPYPNSLTATLGALADLPEWAEIQATLSDTKRYKTFQAEYRAAWTAAWANKAASAPNTLPLWSNHRDRNRYDLRTGNAISRNDE